MSSPFSDELALALRVVHAASLLTKAVLHSLANHVDATSKSDDSPVTVADFAAQAIIISALHAAFPSDSFLGEESAEQLRRNDALAERVWQLVQQAARVEHARSGDAQHVRMHGKGGTTDAEAGGGGAAASSPIEEWRGALVFPGSKDGMLDVIDRGTSTRTDKGRVWIMDPVDGTATFMTGNQYAVCLCLLVDGVQQVSVIGCPNLLLDSSFWSRPSISEDRVDVEGYGVVLFAVKGHGTYVCSMLSSSLGPARVPPRVPPSISLSSSPSKPHDCAEYSPSTIPSPHLNFVESALGSTSLLQPLHQAVARALDVPEHGWPGTTLWSQQMKYVALTLGAADVMLRIPRDRKRYTHVWDHAGGQLLLEESGGWVRDLEGREVDLSKGRLIEGAVNFGMVAMGRGVVQGEKGGREEVLRALREVIEHAGSEGTISM